MMGAKPDAIKKVKTVNFSNRPCLMLVWMSPVPSRLTLLKKPNPISMNWETFPLYYVQLTRWVVQVGASPTIGKSSIQMMRQGLEASPINQVLMEECLLGWKEYEMEVMRDYKDQCVVICSIENFDPMGVHTGDSITIAPAMTLSDKEYQLMRDASFACIREIGVETGGSNIQFSTSRRKWKNGCD